MAPAHHPARALRGHRPAVAVPGAFLTVVVAFAYVTSEAHAWLILSIGVGPSAGTALA
ncbi:hypothetical protein [Streptomyces longhuiensis]|uniref:hypothetical protein n=1 Tax=Streptomyces longhuiensis TaxID=2880933 RepID=UPI001D0B9E21|nr:hypothetical protein [Streptomyces longhuiensis]UDM03332.1 hypothetical protein LGI35_36290 [Streptomyces longhuiensis]